MGRKAMMYFISVVIIIVTTLMFVLFASGETDTNNIVFLKGYGWEVRTKSVEKEDIITHVELSKDFGEADLLTQADIDLYNAIIAERTAKKPSIKKQLAENKGKSEPMKSKTQQQKEDILL
jgi:hypothetical protein